MSDILVKPDQLRTTASQIRQRAKAVRQSLEAVDQGIQTLDSVQFEGNRAVSLRSRYRSTRDRIFAAPDLIARFAAALEDTASRFESADQRLSTGNVLGTSTTTPSEDSHPDLAQLEQQREELKKQFQEKKIEFDKYSARVQELGEEINKIDALADALKIFGIDLKTQSLTGAGAISTVIGLITESVAALAAPIAAEIAVYIDLGKVLGLLHQMEDAAAKSEAVGNEMTQIIHQMEEVNQKIDLFFHLEELPGG